MITAAFARTMAHYNRWQNVSLFAAADTLIHAEREAHRGAFFGSIHGTLSHLLWADTIWMSRFGVCNKPDVALGQSATYVPDWDALKASRITMDERIIGWADALSDQVLNEGLTWFSGAAGREVTKPKGLIITHIFNHQTHHRGQVHAMLTAAGAKPDDTDLFLMGDG